MKRIIYIAVCLLYVQASFSQTQFISSGKIEFERSTNAWAELRGTFADQIKKTIPQYNLSYFNYEFDRNKSIYQPGRASDSKAASFFASTATDNEIYSDYAEGTAVSKKNIFGKPFLIEDSLRNAKWKITNDFREIAGFNCRRATTIIMDSVFVVAFYTDEITIPGGPESFNGLPGMILGLVINRLHTSWYATKVEINSVNTKDITPPTKGEKTTNKKLMETLKKSLSDWGDYATRNIWAAMI
ncbi:MAG: GLPGLI family protein [Ginsengibacter sp.]